VNILPTLNGFNPVFSLGSSSSNATVTIPSSSDVDVDGALTLSRPPKGIEPPPFSELELSATSATKAYSVAAPPGGNGGGE
jgi:hypothetical protein